ncbi:hypothetical protein [Chryseobacterium sp. RR2-3-20]|uniref:hypothetical protein n=1 Tax=Chryseobacterium sp. RR2-3-20 TaxID=2787626 RepID=UPI001AE08957|nr:hypothetical protein [Chryseobacterium sp. RR2-3-20]
MSTETLQINLAQKIFSIWDEKLLQKINNLINSDIVGYTTDGKPLTAEQYRKEIDLAIEELESGKDKGLTTDEVRKNIMNAFNLE